MKINRRYKILECLAEEKSLPVAELAAKVGVSQVTIRKDLTLMEQEGLVKREHGSAHLFNIDDLNGRIAYHYEAKQRIAEKAVELVHDGEIIMIESGSCCAIFADLLAARKKNLTIITNSVFITDYIRNKASFNIILLGGIYQPNTQVLVGPMVKQSVSELYANLYFIGIDGYSPQAGFTNKDPMRAQAIQDMARQAEHVVVLTESAKFATQSTAPLRLQNKKQTVVTDSQISQASRRALQAQQIEILLA